MKCQAACRIKVFYAKMKQLLVQVRHSIQIYGKSVYLFQCPKCHVCIEKNGGCNHMVRGAVSFAFFFD